MRTNEFRSKYQQYFLPHHAVVREQKDSTKVRIVFDASSKYKEYAKACEMLKELYVEDLINGTSDITEAIQLSNEMIYLHSEASMNLRRWETNSPILNEAWKRANVDCRKTSEELGAPLKILGIIWDNMNNNLTFDIKQFEKLRNIVIVTKIIILSTHGMLFDPIDIMNPFTVRMKLLLQTIWELGIPRDECVTSEIKATFIEWLNEIGVLRKYEIPRLYFNEVKWESVELHLFSDAKS
ncbi:hypothetical protein AVEN_134226-1 [Araneus ventricosus]|uniref:Uncharacterized protein n=1 Tax=Araneus ventricosus TaxID=182803 RepID=A0A4Y2EPU5_ARAVE|nr:hypothetical protein AVEN_134226-1 [Araneus ventricosus]